MDVFHQGRKKCLGAANADLWALIYQKLDSTTGMRLTLRWTKGHANDIQVYQQYNVSPRDLLGNLCADRLAERGAEGGQVTLQDAMCFKWHLSIVRQIQARAIVILLQLSQRKPLQNRPPPRKRLKNIPAAGLVLATQHTITCYGQTLQCNTCLKHSPASEKGRKWFLQSPCQVDRDLVRAITVGTTKPTVVPPGKQVRVGNAKLHSTHALKVYRGLYFCAKCGYHASAKAQYLSKPCDPHDSNVAMQRVIRLHAGKLPSGLKAWPNDQASRDPTIAFNSYMDLE